MTKNQDSAQSFEQITGRSSQSSGSNEDKSRCCKNNSTNNKWAKVGGGGISALLCVLTTAAFISKFESIQYQNVQFDFFVYCPVYEEIKYVQRNKFFGQARAQYISQYRNVLQQYADELNHTYVVKMRANSVIKQTSDKKIKLTYCGFARPWSGTCKQAKFLCSSPGPAFDVQQNQAINVIWLNQIDFSVDNLSKKFENTINSRSISNSNNCFTKDQNQHCTKKCKTKQWEQLTYLDPTYSETYQSIQCQKLTGPSGNKFKKNINSIGNSTSKSSLDHYPVSTHVHGLQVRPLFDGNPMSWYDNQKMGSKDAKYALGYGTQESNYFNVFNDRRFSKLQDLLQIHDQNRKINSYPNVQQPGTLWYHDHAMGITGMNVQLGLTSFYIIRNEQSQKDLPKGEYQKLFYVYRKANEAQQLDCPQICKDENRSGKQKCYQKCEQNNNGFRFSDHEFYRNGTYRIRILSGDYATPYNFTVNDPTKNQTINFTVIGTDSALRRQPVHDVSYTYLGPAQRADILINFTNVQGNVVQFNLSGLIVKANILNSSIPGQTPINKQITQIDVPYFNLSQETYHEKVSVKRMRPLVRIDGIHGINGHLNFMSGASQNPKIGSIQDWYLINNINAEHPIHIHLIQFQILEYYQLRTVNCSRGEKGIYLMQLIYQLCHEYNLVDDDNMCYNKTVNLNDAESLCNSIQGTFTGDVFDNFFKQYKVETVDYSQQSDGPKISGMDVFLKGESKRIDYYNSLLKKNKRPLIKDGQYLFIDATKTKDVTDDHLKEWQKGWKDVVLVPKFLVAHIRIRWASTDLTPQCWQGLNSKVKNNSYTLTQSCKNRRYFKVDQRDLLEFPGFLYHCHILRHEDNEMMRPIMMQPSGLLDNEGKQILKWSERWQQLNCQIANYQSPNKDQDNDLRRF